MEKLHFYTIYDLSKHIIDTVDGFVDKFDDVVIVAKYEEAMNVIKYLIVCDPNYSLEYINLSQPDVANYDDEFYVGVINNEIWCEPAYENGHYKHSESKVAFVFDNCSAKVLKNIEAEKIFEISTRDEDELEFEDEDEYCDCDCENCEYSNDNNCVTVQIEEDDENELQGFSMGGNSSFGTWSKSFYSSDPELVAIMLDKWTK